jgi:hypothetical protein
MMLKPRVEILFAAVFYIIVVGIVFYKIVNNPNDFLVASGDGMKNYYTFLYHIKNDSTLMTFEGMNYPFGENIIFTDNQPIIANLIKIISKSFDNILCNLPAIHNLLLLLGLVFGGIGIFLCLRKLEVSFYFSLICAAGLMLLNPQLQRISAHFSMFYPIMPWLFLLWIDFWKGEKQLKNSLIAGLLITCSGLVHMYYFITGAIMVILALFAYVILKKKWLSFKTISLVVVFQILLPFLTLTFFSSYFNHAQDRPTDPWGFFYYHSFWEGLFFSYKLPLFEFVDSNIIEVRDIDPEAKNYIGLFAVSFLLYGLYLLLFRFGQIKTKIMESNINSFFAVLFILSALISFGYPFTISGLEWLLDYTGPFKQFRSIGRIGWVSFYAVNFLAIPYFYRKAKQSYAQNKVLYFTLPFVLLIEGFLFSSKVQIYQARLDAYYCHQESKIPINGLEYQAILPDPYFHIGSECFSWWDQAENINQSFQVGYQLNLPTMGVNMSRTSFKQAKLLNELVVLPYKLPEIINILKQKSEKPLLVLESKLQLNDHRAKLNHWTKNAPVVFENDQFRLKRLELNSFQAIVHEFNDSLAVLPPLKHTYQSELKFDKVQSSDKWGYEAYINFDSPIQGAYSLTYWMECLDASFVLSTTEIWQFDQNHNLLDYIGEGNRFNYKKIEKNKFLFETPLSLKQETTKIVIKVTKHNEKEKDILKISDAVLKSKF